MPYATPGIAKKTVPTYKNGKNLFLLDNSPNFLAPFRGIALNFGCGNHIIIPIILNKRCANATCNASAGLETATLAANNPVTVVPILAPKVKGNICSNVITLMAHKGISVEVVILLDCTNIVTSIPIIIEKYLLYASALTSHFLALPFNKRFNNLIKR